MSDRTIVFTPAAPAAIGPYSQAVVAGGFVHCSGQIALDPATGELVPGDAGEQAARVLANLKAVLEAAGSSIERVVKCRIWLTDLGEFEKVNAVYASVFGEDAPPARACVEVSALPKGAAVEIDCLALVGG